MKFNILILFGLLISTGILNAQSDFRPGYIIKTSGDTIFGQIDYRGDLLMNRLCKFKDIDNSITEYSPNDIEAFRFLDSKYYVSRTLDNKKSFMEYLIKGKVNIYYMHDDKGDHYYIDKEDIKLTEIPYEEGIRYIDNKKIFYESTKHVGFLKYYMQDAPELQTRIQSLKRPGHQNLIKLAEDYHNAVCEDEECIIYEKKIPSIEISIMPFVGVVNYFEYNQFKPSFGGYMIIRSPRYNEKICFNTGLAYQKLNLADKELNIYNIPFQIQYLYSKYQIKPFIGFGFNLLILTPAEYDNLRHTLCLNNGFNYNLTKKLSLNTRFDFEFTPLLNLSRNDNVNFGLVSLSFLTGLSFIL